MTGILSGCGGLPDSGEVGPGREVGPFSQEPLGVAPRGPRLGAGPAEVVDGFLHAGPGFNDDHSVARTFLKSATATLWLPSRGTTIYPDDKSITMTTQGTGSRRQVTVEAPVWGSVGPSGELELARPGTRASQRFSVIQWGGEWRIDGVDEGFGLWMAKYEFERTYTPIRVPFIAKGTRLLVPDLRWFARTRAGLATAIVRSLLSGPRAYLTRAVTSGAPSGTTLGVDAVPTLDGTATVDLSEAALRAAPEQRRQLRAQLVTVLRQLPNVSQVEITVGGVAYPVDGSGSPSSGRDLGYTDLVAKRSPHLLLGTRQIWRVDNVFEGLVSGLDKRFSGMAGQAAELRSIATDPDGRALAGVDRSGTRLMSLTAASSPVLLGRAGDLLAPVLDAAGWVWTADQASSGSVLVTPASTSGAAAPSGAAGLTALSPPWLKGRRIVGFDVSDEGARIAVISVGVGGQRRLDLAGIVRGADGKPEFIETNQVVGQSLGDARDVSWADSTHLVVLTEPMTPEVATALGKKALRKGSIPTSPPLPRQQLPRPALRPYLLEVGGVTTALPTAPDPVRIWAGDGLRETYLVTAGGKVLARAGGAWRDLGRKVSIPVPR